jgi:hypothetical protein
MNYVDMQGVSQHLQDLCSKKVSKFNLYLGQFETVMHLSLLLEQKALEQRQSITSGFFGGPPHRFSQGGQTY